MKAYYINLERSVERRSHMEDQAARLKLDLCRIDAVDGRTLSANEYAQFCPAKGRTHHLSTVEVACFLSHRKAWQQIADGLDSHGLVLEDDLFLSPDFPQFANATDWIHPSCDIVKVETIVRPLLLKRPMFDAGGGRKLWRMASENMGGGGYILSRTIAKELVEHTKTFADPVDCVLFHPNSFVWQSMGVYQLDPALCVQQVRSKTVFLDARAAVSQMDGRRGTIKKSGLTKALTELTRPIAQLFQVIAMTFRAIFSGGRYGRVKLK